MTHRNNVLPSVQHVPSVNTNATALACAVPSQGRFPHRNAVLGRESTPEEVKGLEDKTIPRF